MSSAAFFYPVILRIPRFKIQVKPQVTPSEYMYKQPSYQVKEYLDNGVYSGPVLSIKKHKISEQVHIFRQALPDVVPHYAVKANPLPEVLSHLDKLGVNFEIASQGELELLKSLNIAANRIIFSNPIKTPSSIKSAVAYGIRYFAFDNPEELLKLHQLAPDAHYELRISTNGKGSVWPLTKKFGMDINEAKSLIKYASDHGISISGLTFHVGSQCTKSEGWITAIKDCEALIKYMHEKDMSLKLLNIGGGFPCHFPLNSYSFEQLMLPVKQVLDRLIEKQKKQHNHLKICAEPGRFLVAAAGTITCQIISTTRKKGQPWAFLDCGFYNGLMELTEDFGFTFSSKKQGPLIPWTIAGPTCDSIDCFSPKYDLPNNSTANDIINIDNMGAYANSCVSNFNGFEGPKVEIME